MARAHWLKAQGRGEEAIPEYEMLIALNRNSVSALANLSNCKVWAGFIDESIALLEQVLSLSPRDPYSGNRYAMIGYARLLQSRTDEAVAWLKKGCNLAPSHPGHHANLAAAYGLNGQTERAAAELAEARRLCPDDRYSSIARLKVYPYSAYRFSVPKVRAQIETTLWVGYRKAGMPEE
jgi:tetratricopeptide (TPR) repeat protein